jgi:hypothetical protein
MSRVGTLLVLAGLAAGFSPAAGRAAAADRYADPSSWLCRPGRSDACSAPLTSTVVAPASGELTKRTYSPDPDAPIDCFYVYPTVSQEPTPNADMRAGTEEQRVARQQFARFGAKCRTFAPIYRQTTVAALRGAVPGADPKLAYDDVLAAWRRYLAQDNQGRGVVLVGHSQGSFLLARLIAQEIDGKPVQMRLVSAIIPGADIQVPIGRNVGGAFQHIPLCKSAAQAGCIIAYSSYLASDPPGAGAFFGKAGGPGSVDACVNPAALLGADSLDAELPTTGQVAERLGTAFVQDPGLIAADCVTSGDRTFLAISIKQTGVGSQTLTRALGALDARAPGWGLHAIDVNLALGDLVEIVGRQGQAWMAQKR